MAIVEKTIKFDGNHIVLKNTGTDLLVYKQIITPDYVEEGTILILELDHINRGGGIFIRNGNAAAGSDYNLRLGAWYVSPKLNMQSGLSENAGTSNTKNAMGHVVDALQAILDEDTAALGDAVSAASAANAAYDNVRDSNWLRRTLGDFAYGVGGNETLDYTKHGQVITTGGVDYISYDRTQVMVVLSWRNGVWRQEAMERSALS